MVCNNGNSLLAEGVRRLTNGGEEGFQLVQTKEFVFVAAGGPLRTHRCLLAERVLKLLTE